jgi:hypothetical protein
MHIIAHESEDPLATNVSKRFPNEKMLGSSNHLFRDLMMRHWHSRAVLPDRHAKMTMQR